MLIKTKGIVLKHRNIGENDKIVTILTPNLGVIEATARNTRTARSRMNNASELLYYGDFCLFKGKSHYIINSADEISSFYKLRLDVVLLSLAGYFSELTAFLCREGDPNSAGYLKLILNTFHFLVEGKKSVGMLKSLFELRALTIGGFMPNLVCCTECAVYESEMMYFLPLDGTMICADCMEQQNFQDTIKYPVIPSVLAAMRFIVYSPLEKLFSFKLSGISLEQLNLITENYALLHTEEKFNSLKMFHSLKGFAPKEGVPPNVVTTEDL